MNKENLLNFALFYMLVKHAINFVSYLLYCVCSQRVKSHNVGSDISCYTTQLKRVLLYIRYGNRKLELNKNQ